MVDWLRYSIIGASLALAVAAYIDFRTAKPPRIVTLGLAGLALLLIVIQTVIAAIKLAQGAQVTETGTFIGYLATTILILPAVGYVARIERSKWSALAMMVGGFTVAVLAVRLEQLWSA